MSPPTSTASCEDVEDELEPSAPVLAVLQIDQVPALAANLLENKNVGRSLPDIQGISLQDLWFDNAPENHQRRVQVLEDVAAVMVQLNQFSFSLDGRFLFGGRGEPVGIGPLREVDRLAMHNRDASDLSEKPNFMPIYVEGDCVVDLFRGSDSQFTLIHPDYDIPNFIVSQEGKLFRIID
ncbi:hypothetical protein PT974_05129 [Cladobotryum mycophilum]|uniref:Uncharacterized protein n=1 Tax=Cladobotryum mycophilum TaxID=491253 RepID=A0ABR0SR47_9HYPO